MGDGFAGLIIFLQERLGLGIEQLAWAFLPSGLVWALLPSRLGSLADRFGRKRLMVLGLVGAAVVSFLVPSLTSWIMLAVLWGGLALFAAAGDPAEQALVADLTGDDQRGKAYRLYALAGGHGATVGPVDGAWLYTRLGPAAPFYANGLILAVCAIVLWALLEEPRRQTSAAATRG
jgi:MFS family permease